MTSICTNDDFCKKIRPVLDLLDDVRELMGDIVGEGIEIPCTVVVGNQSAGKSSLIERLLRIRMPRGEGMVTKTPVVISLRQGSEENIHIHKKGMAPKDIEKSAIASEMETLSNIILGTDPNPLAAKYKLSKEPIYLNVTRPDLVDLTLVDLPGDMFFTRRNINY